MESKKSCRFSMIQFLTQFDFPALEGVLPEGEAEVGSGRLIRRQILTGENSVPAHLSVRRLDPVRREHPASGPTKRITSKTSI